MSEKGGEGRWTEGYELGSEEEGRINKEREEKEVMRE